MSKTTKTNKTASKSKSSATTSKTAKPTQSQKTAKAAKPLKAAAKTPQAAKPGDAQVIALKTPSASYEIAIGRGLLATLYPRLQKLTGGKPFRTFLVTSPKIWELWADKVRASFPEAQSPTVLFLPAGEKHKRMAAVESLAEQLAEAGADRDALLLAFGGGVIGDITGFLAAIYMRGVPYVQLPTTLLAQVDSSVGGKTGVNLKAGKNLVGSFHHPRAVLADIDTLATLAPEELRAGLQESIKAGIIRDPKLFEYLEQNRDLVLSGDATALAEVVAASVRVKAEVVEQDELESGLRMILNFGHTLGHAIEAATGYKQLLHGEAVAWGSIAALYLALARKTITDSQFTCMATVIEAYGPLPKFKAKAKALVALTASDKKTRSGKRAFVLPTGIGSTEIAYDVTDTELHEAAKAMLDRMKAL
ncbi:3-dehydroquinate synthase [Granulicella sp. WH15]|nr:3-dehydroquinate synthase [Granulicella sp. WH15]